MKFHYYRDICIAGRRVRLFNTDPFSSDGLFYCVGNPPTPHPHPPSLSDNTGSLIWLALSSLTKWLSGTKRMKDADTPWGGPAPPLSDGSFLHLEIISVYSECGKITDFWHSGRSPQPRHSIVWDTIKDAMWRLMGLMCRPAASNHHVASHEPSGGPGARSHGRCFQRSQQ